MGTCELCGAEGVGLRRVPYSKTTVEACIRCVDRMGLATPSQPVNPSTKKSKPAVQSAVQPSHRQRGPMQGGYGSAGKAGKDIMVRGEMTLVDDFDELIVEARRKKGLNQRELAQKINETVNVIKKAEKGNRPTDGVIKKLEHELGISLMAERKPDTERMPTGGNSPTRMTLGDYLKDGL